MKLMKWFNHNVCMCYIVIVYIRKSNQPVIIQTMIHRKNMKRRAYTALFVANIPERSKYNTVNSGSENTIMIRTKMKTIPPISSGNMNFGLFCEYNDKVSLSPEFIFLFQSKFYWFDEINYLDYSVHTSNGRKQRQNYCQNGNIRCVYVIIKYILLNFNTVEFCVRQWKKLTIEGH